MLANAIILEQNSLNNTLPVFKNLENTPTQAQPPLSLNKAP